ncbi:MAG: PAS domain-containing protein [Rhodospirillaceae bacterium]|nr:PAS domain-containing protein [Rhodospirillaceae bacterium]
MVLTTTILAGHERSFSPNDVIVTKTNLKGRITYANQSFPEISSLTAAQALGAPYSVIRHPGMPRCVFKLLWKYLQAGREIFAYVLNRATNGDHYWVLARVTPSFDGNGKVVGYHSNRRATKRSTFEQVIRPLYQDVLQIEDRKPDRKIGMNRAHDVFSAKLQTQQMTYDQ